jgi:serine protease Do
MSKKTTLLLSASFALLVGGSVVMAQKAAAPPAPPSVATPAAPPAPVAIQTLTPPAIAAAPTAPLAGVWAVAAAAPPAPPVALAPPAPSSFAVPPAPPAPLSLSAPPQGMTLFSMQDNFLGVQVEEVTKETMGRFNLREPRGVAVTRVVKDSPAERAGLRENDVILRFDGETVSSLRKLNRLIDESAPEHTARLTISRGGAERELSVTLASRREIERSFRTEIITPEQRAELSGRGKEWGQLDEQTRKQIEERMRKQFDELGRNQQGLFSLNFAPGRRIGVSTTRLTDQLADYFGVERGRGVLVSSVREDSPAARAGLKAGDVITEVEGERVAQAADLSRAINRKPEGEITLTVVHDKKSRTVKLTPERAPQSFDFNPGDFDAPTVALTLPRINMPSIALPRFQITTPRVNLPRIVIPRIRVRPMTNGINSTVM